MTARVFFLFLFAGRVLSQLQSQSCSTINDCDVPIRVCKNGDCDGCSNNDDCISQHSTRRECTKIQGNYWRCVQCSQNQPCSEAGQTCVTDDLNYLCATSCSGPSDTCPGNSQCVYVRSGSGGSFYCLSCENNSDCRKWSGISASTCNVSGKCSPEIVACTQQSHCTSPTASDCSSTYLRCQPCSQDSHCNHLTATPKCKSGGGRCVKCNNHVDCTNLSAPRCDFNNCGPCTENSHCDRFSTTKKCSGGTCVECINDSDCSNPEKAKCSSNTCVPCTASTQCEHFPTKKKCNSTSGGTCVQCMADSDCLSETAANCRSNSNTCQGCMNSETHCARFTSTPLCKNPGFSTGVCVQCLTDSDCPDTDAAHCSGSNICVPCTANNHCSNHLSLTPVCKNPSSSSGVCVQCVTNSDCPEAAAAYCSGDFCIPCTEGSHCSHLDSTPLCKNPGLSGVCVQCVNDGHCPTPAAARCEADSCTTCTEHTQCNSRSWSKPFCSGGACVECLSINDCTDGKICSSGVCTSCTNSIQCTNPAASVCSPAGKCVECVNHSDCSDPENAECSSSNTCVPCTDSTPCDHFDSAKVCSTFVVGTCVECDADSHCSDPAHAECDTSANTCIACTDSTHCDHLSLKKVCKSPGSTGECVECVSHSNCTSTEAPLCSDSNICVECLEDSDCSNTTLAKCSSNACAACTEDSHCSKFPMTPICSNPSGGACVQCVSDANCPTVAAAQCASNTCAPCTASSQCTHLSSTPVCKISTGSCVECLSDSDCTTDPSKSHCITLLNTCVSPCVPNCLQCLNSTACQVCLPGYYLLNSTCVTTCPSGYWQNDPTQTCELCDPTCQTCNGSAMICTSCFPPYVLDGSKCQTPPGISPPTVTLKSSSDPQTFLLVFSNPMAVTPETLSQTLQFSLTGMTFSTDYYLLNVTKQPDSKTFKIIFNFTKSVGIETLTVTFSNQQAVVDEDGLVVIKKSVSSPTTRFTFFTEGEKKAAESLTNVGSGVSNAALSSSVGMFVAGGSGGIMWAFLGLFQIVNYLLFLNVNYPYNVVTFLKLFSMSSLNGIVPNPMEYLFPSIWEEMEAGLPSPPKFADNEMDALYLSNAGQTVVAWVAVGTLYILAKIILFLFRTTGRFNRLITNFKEKFEWGLVYNAFIGTYPELIIASCLQFVNMDFTTPLHRFSSVAALIIGALCFCAPFAVTYAMESSAEILGSQLHEKKHGALYEPFIVQTPKNAKVSPETAYYRRNFMAFIFLRKLVYFSGIVFAYDIPILQMLITCCSGLVLLIFMIRVKPFRTKRDAWMNIGTEVFMVMIHLVIFVFAGDDITLKLTDTQRKNVGWALIFLCCAMVAYNVIFIFVQQVLALWSFGQLVMHAICKKTVNSDNRRRSITHAIERRREGASESLRRKISNSSRKELRSSPRREVNKSSRDLDSYSASMTFNNNFVIDPRPQLTTKKRTYELKTPY